MTRLPLLLALGLSAPAAAVPSVDEPLRTGERSPADAAVVIGVEDYFAVEDVPYAEADAQAFYDFLVYTRGVPAANVRRLTVGANREKILRAVEDAAGLVGEGGLLWVYFAGHGAASPTDGQRMLLGADVQADLDTFEARAVKLAEIHERAAKGRGELVMVLDTCYTGQGRSGGAVLGGKRFAVPSYAMAAEAKGSAIEWTAASANQFSGPLDSARHGAFTWAVIGALRGWADGQISGRPDGEVTAEEASLFVEEALRTLQITDQTPVLSGGDAAALVLSRGRGLERRPELAPPRVVAEPVAAVTPAPSVGVPAVGGSIPPVGGSVASVASAGGACGCGGDPTGRWSVPDFGFPPTPAGDPSCPGMVASGSTAGQFDLGRGGLVTTTVSSTTTMTMPAACAATAGGCPAIAASMPGVSCVANPYGDCTCSATDAQTLTGSWTAAGSRLTIAFQGQPASTACFCAQGDELTITDDATGAVTVLRRVR